MFKNRRGFVETMVVVWLGIAVVSGLVAIWKGPELIKATSGIFQGQAQKKATASKTLERTYYVPDEKNPGKFIKDHTDKMSEATMNLDSTEPPETLWQKFWKMGFMAVAIIVLLSYLGIWPVIVAWYKAKVKPQLTQAQADLQESLNSESELRGDAKLIVRSVDEGLAALNSSISAAEQTVAVANQALNAAALQSDPTVRAAGVTNAQVSIAQATAVLTALTNARRDFLAAMSRKQDTTTKLLVAELKND